MQELGKRRSAAERRKTTTKKSDISVDESPLSDNKTANFMQALNLVATDFPEVSSMDQDFICLSDRQTRIVPKQNEEDLNHRDELAMLVKIDSARGRSAQNQKSSKRLPDVVSNRHKRSDDVLKEIRNRIKSTEKQHANSQLLRAKEEIAKIRSQTEATDLSSVLSRSYTSANREELPLVSKELQTIINPKIKPTIKPASAYTKKRDYQKLAGLGLSPVKEQSESKDDLFEVSAIKTERHLDKMQKRRATLNVQRILPELEQQARSSSPKRPLSTPQSPKKSIAPALVIAKIAKPIIMKKKAAPIVVNEIPIKDTVKVCAKIKSIPQIPIYERYKKIPKLSEEQVIQKEKEWTSNTNITIDKYKKEKEDKSKDLSVKTKVKPSLPLEVFPPKSTSSNKKKSEKLEATPPKKDVSRKPKLPDFKVSEGSVSIPITKPSSIKKSTASKPNKNPSIVSSSRLNSRASTPRTPDKTKEKSEPASEERPKSANNDHKTKVYDRLYDTSNVMLSFRQLMAAEQITNSKPNKD